MTATWPITGPQGPPGPVVLRQSYEYNFSMQVGAPPSPGQVRADNADVSQATAIYLSTMTADSVDVAHYLDPAQKPTSPQPESIYAQDKNNAGAWVRFTVTSMQIQPGYVEYTSTYAEGGSGTVNNNERVVVTFTGVLNP